MKRRVLKIAGIIIGVVAVVLSVTIFLLYKNQKSLVQSIIADVNEQFTGHLIVKDSHISPFKAFPYISIDLEGVVFYEDKTLETRPVYEINDLYIGFSLFDVITGKLDIKTIIVQGGHLDLILHEDGTLNLMRAKNMHEEDTTVSESSLHIDLKKIAVKDFQFTKLNEATKQLLAFQIDNAESSFKLQDDHIFAFLDSKLLLNVINNGDTSFFKNKHLELHTTLDFNQTSELLTIKKSAVKLEDGLFALSGSIDINDDLLLDLTLEGDKPDFDLLIAFAPEDVAANLKRFKNEGKIYFDGHITGKSTNGHYPQVNVKFGCENGYFLNVANDKKVDQLGFRGEFKTTADGSPKNMELILTNVTARPDKGTFRGDFTIRDFEDPHVAVKLYSDLDLKFLGDFIGVEGFRGLEGQVIVTMDFDEFIDLDAPEKSLAKLKKGVDSELIIKELSFTVPGFPHAVRNMNVHATMASGLVNVDSVSFTVGQSDFNFAGTLSNLPAIFHHQHEPVDVTVSARSKKIILKELVSFDSLLAQSTDEEIADFSMKLAFKTSTDNLYEANPLPKGEFFIEDFYAKLNHFPHTFHDFHADILIGENALTLKDFSGEIDNTDFHFSGALTNYPLWFSESKKGDTRFEFDFVSHHLHLHDLLTYKGENYLPEDYKNETIHEFNLHGTVDMHYDSVLRSSDLVLTKMNGRCSVHPLKLENFSGRIHTEDDHITITDFGGKMGRSEFAISLSYFSGKEKTRQKRENYLSLTAYRIDLDELMNYNPKEDSAHEEAFNIFQLPFTDMKIEANLRRVNYHSLWLRDFTASLRLQENHYLYIDTLHFGVTGGQLSMAGYLNGSDPSNIYFKSTMNLRDVDLEKAMIKLDQFGQDVTINKNLRGTASGTITSLLHVHPDLTPILEDGEAHLDIEIKNGSLVNFSPMMALSSYFKDKNLNMVRFDTLRNKLDLKDGVLTIPRMNINSSLGFIELSGTQSLNLNMDYNIHIPLQLVTEVGFKALFGGKSKTEVDPDQIDAIEYRDPTKRTRFLNVRVSGTPDDYKIGLGKK